MEWLCHFNWLPIRSSSDLALRFGWITGDSTHGHHLGESVIRSAYHLWFIYVSESWFTRHNLKWEQSAFVIVRFTVEGTYFPPSLHTGKIMGTHFFIPSSSSYIRDKSCTCYPLLGSWGTNHVYMSPNVSSVRHESRYMFSPSICAVWIVGTFFAPVISFDTNCVYVSPTRNSCVVNELYTHTTHPLVYAGRTMGTWSSPSVCTVRIVSTWFSRVSS